MKRTMYICDGEGGKCVAVLLHPEDGFILPPGSKILTAVAGEEQQVVISAPEESELALCRDCFLEQLGAASKKGE